ncbi:patatin-like phospholipase family protein [Myxococcus sp. AM001]|nr:patatin-like phospholipase family protein [Myxococcus sp. AM001]
MSDSAEVMWEQPAYREGDLALTLSGGGLRATLFHLGVLERLYEMRVLDDVRYLSTVSGGSILGGWLALHWAKLMAAEEPSLRGRLFDVCIAQPIVDLARADIRNRAVRRWLRPKGWGNSGAENVRSILDDLLFKGATLGHLPPEESLRVSLNATNLRNGKRFRFSRASVGDYHGGYTRTRVAGIPLATAVAASAAFPGMFGPLRLQVQGPFKRWTFSEPPVLEDAFDVPDGCVYLMDGGIYDNIGLQAAFQRCGKIIAVDAGQPLDVDFPVSGGPSSMLRAVDIMMSQIVSRPTSKFVRALLANERQGVFIRSSRTAEEIATRPSGTTSALEEGSYPGLNKATATALAQLRTDLDSFSPLEIDLLRYHGRTLADASLRRFQPAWVQAAPPIPQPTWTTKATEEMLRGRTRRLLPLLALWQGW